MMSYMEKRVDERADVTTSAKFKILSDSENGASNGYEEGTIRNISKGGLCIQVLRKITEGNVVRIEIPGIDKESGRTIKAFCEVQWCVKSGDSNFEAGLSFIALKEEDVDYLNAIVAKQKRAM